MKRRRSHEVHSKEHTMQRNHVSLGSSLVVAAALVLAATGTAFAQDSSMSRLTGDSYAYFNHLDFHAGGFNTERAPQMPEHGAAAQAQSPAKAATKPPAAAPSVAERPTMLADRPANVALPSPFSDTTGA
jgi:hypothetical protein